MTIHIDINYVTRIEDENKQLKDELLKSDYVKASVFSDREEYKQRISKLVSENEQLKNDLKIKNDIIKNTLTIDRYETDDYINRLKQELFNLYLKHYN